MRRHATGERLGVLRDQRSADIFEPSHAVRFCESREVCPAFAKRPGTAVAQMTLARGVIDGELPGLRQVARAQIEVVFADFSPPSPPGLFPAPYFPPT